MRIAEILTSELRRGHNQEQEPHARIVALVESLIQQLELQSSVTSLLEISSELQRAVTQLTELAPFPNTLNLHIWKLSYRLWNACVDLSNFGATTGVKFSEDHANLRQVSADLLFLAANVTGIPSPAVKCASFFYKTGLIWHDLRKFDLANVCFEKATDLISKIEMNKLETDERKLLLDLNLARSRIAWEVSDWNLSTTLLNRSKTILFGISENYKALANQFLVFGKIILSKKEASKVNDALKLMNEALELCDKGLKLVKKTGETLELKELRAKTLRFIAAVHLQRDEFENVIKCVRVLRDTGGEHPSLSVLAMKAWLGLGRYEEAEKELRGMTINKGIPEAVWISAIELYFQAVGTAGAETAKGLFLGLLGRCHVSAFAAVRVVNRVLGNIGFGVGEAAKMRAKVVAELVSDERVVALLAGEAVSKERTAMHALLWNW